MLIPLDRIHDGANVRHHAPGEESDAALAASIGRLGVLQPVLVVEEAGGHYAVIAGRRRVAAARAAGLTEIPVVVQPLNGADMLAASAAENMVRAPLHPVDTWRAMAAMTDQGHSIETAAASLGLSVRYARLLEKLSRLHPTVLAAIEAHGMPERRDLATIAAAPPAQQAKALKAARSRDNVRWWEVSRKCETTRIPRGWAIFDTDAVTLAWDEDLFAEPGSDQQFTTADVAGFVRAQQAALRARVEAAQARGEPVELVGWKNNDPVLPAGHEREWSPPSDPAKPPRGWRLFVCVAQDGHYTGQVKEAWARAKGGIKAGPGSSGKAGKGAAALEPEKRPAVSQRGEEMIAAAKTQALRERLASSPVSALPLLVLAFSASNVRVMSDAVASYDQLNFRDIMADLVTPEGVLQAAAAETAAARLLARVLCVGSSRSVGNTASGDAAEWIGRAIGADAALPRFDTEAFLETLSGDALRELALSADVATKGAKVGELRKLLVGKLPDWRPAGATFGAPGPKPAGKKGGGR